MTSEHAGMTKDNLEAMNYQDISFLKKENRKTRRVSFRCTR